MAEYIARWTRWRRIAVDEFLQLWSITAYLYVCFIALIFFKAAILRGHGISFTPWGLAIVKALMLAKFIMIGNAMRVGRGSRSWPMIWLIAYQTIACLVFLFLMNLAEEVIVGMIHGRPAAMSLGELAGPRLAEMMASCFLMLLILVPYFTLRRFDEYLGEGEITRILFLRPSAAPATGPRTGEMPGPGTQR